MSEQVGQLTISVQEYPRRYRIEQADPVVDIDAELLADMRRANRQTPSVTITRHEERGEVLTIADDYGRTAIYVIDPIQPTAHTYRMRWVD